MSSLTTMLRRAGVLGDVEVGRIDAYCRDHRLPPVTGIVALGLVEEARLVSFLQSRLMIPIADAWVLARVPTAVATRIPSSLAWNHRALPVSVDRDGNLTVAMADPTDEQAVCAISAHTGGYLVRAVAGPTALRNAVERVFGAPPAEPAFSSEPGDAASFSDGVPVAVIPTLSFPAEAPMATEPLSVQAFTDVQATLDAAPNRDVITETLLEFLGQGFERVILFIHLRGQLRGRDARGSDLMVDAVTRVRIPTGAGSLFADVANSGVPYWGAWPLSRPTDKAFAQAMGGIGGRALLLPVRLRDKIPLIVFASGTSVEVTLDAFKKLGEATSTALERILFKKKSSQTNIETP